jgi:hypothetical protein
MNSRPHSLEDLQDRLLRLERQNRRFKQLGAVMLAIAAVIVVMGQAPAKKTVEANEFILRDDSGNVRAKLSMVIPAGAAPGSPVSPQLALIDDKGKERVKLDGNYYTPGLSLYDSQSRYRGFFGEVLGSDMLFLQDENRNLKSRLKEGEVLVGEIHANRVEVLDTSGSIRATLSMMPPSPTSTTMTIPGIDHPVPVTVSPTPTLALYGDKGETKVMLDTRNIAFENSEGKLGGQLGDGMLTLGGEKDSFAVLSPYNLNLQDQDGFLATLGVTSLVTPRTGESHKTSAASLVLFDNRRNVIWKAP